MWKDRVYYVLCDGFDELFAGFCHEIYGESNSLPIETSVISNKSSELIENFINNSYLVNSSSKHILNDIEKLKQQANRDTMHDFIKNLNSGKNQNQDSTNDNYTDTELIMLLKLEAMASNDELEKTVTFARTSLLECKNDGLKIKILSILIELYEDNDRTHDAIKVCDEVIEIDSNNTNYYIKKSNLVSDYDEKMRILDRAIDIDPYYARLFYEKAILLETRFFSNSLPFNGEEHSEIISILNTGITRSPSLSNNCWSKKFDFIQKTSKSSETEQLEEIVLELEEQDKHAPIVLRKKLSLLDKNIDSQEKNEFLDLIKESKNKAVNKYKWIYSLIYIDALSKFNVLDDLRVEIEELLTSNENNNSHKILVNIASKELKKFDDLNTAINLLEKSIAMKVDSNAVGRLSTLYQYANNTEKAHKLLKAHKKEFVYESYLLLLLPLYTKRNEYEKAEQVSKELSIRSLFAGEHFIEQNYLLIKKGSYHEALAQLHSQLSQGNFRLEMSTEIVNYELCRKRTGKKVSKERLNNLLEFTKDSSMKAAIHSLLDDHDKAINVLEKELAEDNESKYICSEWPVFDDLRENSDFKILFKLQ